MPGTLLVDPFDRAPLTDRATRRRSSVASKSSETSKQLPLRRASIPSLHLLTPSSSVPRRSPLAPLGPQMTAVHAYADTSSPWTLKDSGHSYGNESLPNLFDPPTSLGNSSSSWYNGIPPHARPIASPLRLSQDSRRTSLPALHFTAPTQPLPNSRKGKNHLPPIHFAPLQPPTDSRLFDHLSSYVLGPKREEEAVNSDAGSAYVPPSPRTSVVSRGRRPGDEDDSDSPDEADLIRRLDRAKLRAIDDGTRRPSLPINIPPNMRHPDVEMIVEDTKPLPDIPAVPSSDPGPAMNDFNLDFIFGQRDSPNGPMSTYDPLPIERRMSVSLDTGMDSPGLEDSFARFVDQNDHEYRERRAEWSFRRPGANRMNQDADGIWECGSMGKFWVATDRGDNAPSSEHAPRKTSLVIRQFPTTSDSSRLGPSRLQHPLQPTSPPPSSAVRIHIHKHSRAPAYSMFLGSWNPVTAPTTSILLATKKVHLHVSSSPKKASRTRGQTISSPPTSPTPPHRVRFPPRSEIPGEFWTPPPRDQSLNQDLEQIHLPVRLPPPSQTPVPPFVHPSIHAADEMAIDIGMTSHAIAFDTMSPQIGEALLEQVRSKTTFGGRIKRVLGAAGPHPHHGAPSSGALDGVYSPPWMLLAPGYLKDENVRKAKKIHSSFETVGLLGPARSRKDPFTPSNRSVSTETSRSPSSSGSSPSRMTPSSYDSEPLPPWPVPNPVLASRPSISMPLGGSPLTRNTVLADISGDIMCMAVPLWDFRTQIAENRPPPSSHEWLLVYYVPFTAEPPPTSPHPSRGFLQHSVSRSKKRPRKSSSATIKPYAGAGASSSLSSGKYASFRIVARILSATDLKHSGLRYPAVTESEDDADEASPPTDLGGKEAFSAVIAICHDARAGVEYIPEGLDSLGLCGTPPRPATGPVDPFTFERDCTTLTPVGREVVEITWAGCLSLMSQEGDH